MTVCDSNKACFSHERTKQTFERFIPERNDLKQFTSSKHAIIKQFSKESV